MNLFVFINIVLIPVSNVCFEPMFLISKLTTQNKRGGEEIQND